MASPRAQSIDWKVRAVGALELENLALAPLFSWRGDLLSAAIGAAESLPSPVTLGRNLMHGRSGLYLFDRAIPFGGCDRPISGVGWAPLGESDYIFFWLYTPTIGTKWSSMGPLTSYAAFCLSIGSSVEAAVRDGASLDLRMTTSDKNFRMEGDGDIAIRFMLASWLWLKQTIMRADPQSANRNAVKLADRAGVSSSVNVIVLRRAEGKSVATLSEREYHHQWMVRGHWRQQFYAKTNEHRPLWIDSYVKGPEDKPFMAPKETVFAVTR